MAAGFSFDGRREVRVTLMCSHLMLMRLHVKRGNLGEPPSRGPTQLFFDRSQIRLGLGEEQPRSRDLLVGPRPMPDHVRIRGVQLWQRAKFSK